MTGYPRWFVPALLGTLLLMFASGALLAPTTLTMRLDWDVSWRLPGGSRVTVAALHAAGGFTLMLLMGALWSVHMRSGWRRRQQRASNAPAAWRWVCCRSCWPRRRWPCTTWATTRWAARPPWLTWFSG